MIKKVMSLLCAMTIFFGLSACAKEAPALRYYEEPSTEGETSLFYRPGEGVLADVIPYYEDGKFWLYFLHDYASFLRGRRGLPEA